MLDRLRLRAMEYRLDRGKTISRFERYLDRKIGFAHRKRKQPILRTDRKQVWKKADYTIHPAYYRADGTLLRCDLSPRKIPKPPRVQRAHERWPEFCGRVRTSN